MNTKETTNQLHQVQLQTYCSWEDEQETSEEELQGMSRFVVTLAGSLATMVIAFVLLIIF